MSSILLMNYDELSASTVLVLFAGLLCRTALYCSSTLRSALVPSKALGMVPKQIQRVEQDRPAVATWRRVLLWKITDGSVHKMPMVQGKTMIIQPVDLCRFRGTPFSDNPERRRACELLRKKKQSDSKESCENVVLGNGHPRNNTD